MIGSNALSRSPRAEAKSSHLSVAIALSLLTHASVLAAAVHLAMQPDAIAEPLPITIEIIALGGGEGGGMGSTGSSADGPAGHPGNMAETGGSGGALELATAVARVEPGTASPQTASEEPRPAALEEPAEADPKPPEVPPPEPEPARLLGDMAIAAQEQQVDATEASETITPKPSVPTAAPKPRPHPQVRKPTAPVPKQATPSSPPSSPRAPVHVSTREATTQMAPASETAAETDAHADINDHKSETIGGTGSHRTALASRGLGDGGASSATGNGGHGPGIGSGSPGPRFRLGAPGNPAPRYPRRARQQGYEGRVVLAVRVSRAGVPVSVHVTKSSGHRILDDTALETVRRWRFTPAPDAQSTASLIIKVPIAFRLTN